MKNIAFWVVLAAMLGFSNRSFAQEKVMNSRASNAVSLRTLLDEMANPEVLARWPEPFYTTRQASSYDRRTVSPDQPGWWANDDFSQYLRSEEIAGRREQVMLDVDGPGAIVRFWLTAGAPKNGTLRIYLDGNAQPALTFNDFDLETGGLKVPPALLYRHASYAPDKGGNTLYLPIPYAKHCKVTWKEGERAAQRYYHINYRTYAPELRVTTWTREQMERDSAIIERIARRLETPPATVAGRVTSFNRTLSSRQSAHLDLPSGPAAVRMLEMSLDTSTWAPENVEQMLRSVIVQMNFDGEATVWCPVSDFFGSGVGLNELRNVYQTVYRDGVLRCRWVMPYRKNARITVLNGSEHPINATLHATTSAWNWDERSMHFHANWRYESGLKTIPSDRVMENTTIKDWNFISIRGRGVYVGDALSLFNPVATWYGEGDEKIFVDGEKFPSHMGTGTEDYYGYSYAPRPVFQTPFVNHTRIDSPSTQGYNAMARVRPLDSIPFQKSLHFDIELISWAPTTLTYAATTYWYAFPGASTNVAPQLQNATLPVQTLDEVLNPPPLTPNAIEMENLRVVSHSPTFTPETQEMAPWDESRWSKGRQLLAKAKKVGDFAEVEIPANDTMPRRFLLRASQANDYGILRFTVNGQVSTTTFDGYAPQVQPGKSIDLGVFAPQNGKYLLRAEVIGSNPKAEKEGTLFGLDFVELMKP